MQRSRIIHRAGSILAIVGLAGVAPSIALAQTACDSTGPDIIVGEITGVANYNSLGGIEAFSWGGSFCNIGDQGVVYSASTSEHPVFGQSLFRLKVVDGAARFEQIGQSWLQHGFFALSSVLCCSGCEATDGTHLGVRCMDPTTASRAGSQQGLGPKYQVNPATGVFAYPPANPATAGTVSRRMQARITDIDTALNAGALYFAQTQSIARDDAAAGNDDNNASYRRVTFSGSGAAWNMSITAQTIRERAAIQAWKASDPTVSEAFVAVPEDGLFIVAAKATPLASGLWRYEYAVFNMNSHRAAREFSVAIPLGVTAENAGFHDVDYHSGDGIGNSNFDGTDWSVSLSNNAISWSTATFDDNPSANALRWGTLYNFRFDCDAPPIEGAAVLGLFRTGDPDTVSVDGVPVPSSDSFPCRADFNGNQVLDVPDIFAYLAAWFAGDLATDFDGSGPPPAVDDLFLFLAEWFAGCP